MALITYAMAAHHLKLDPTQTSPPSEQELDLLAKMEQATAEVLRHCKLTPQYSWTAETDAASDPEFSTVQANILLVLGHLWRFRGDDENMPDLSKILGSRLSELRDPSFA